MGQRLGNSTPGSDRRVQRLVFAVGAGIIQHSDALLEKSDQPLLNRTIRKIRTKMVDTCCALR